MGEVSLCAAGCVEAGREVKDGVRLLPHALEAERACLGAILVNATLYDTASQLLTAEDFYRQAHRKVWAAFGVLNTKRVPIDLLTLKQELDRAGDLEEVGPGYLPALTDGVPRSSNVAHYAGIVREQATLRSLIALANTVLADAYEREMSSAEIIEGADRRIIDLQRGTPAGMQDVRSESLYDEIEYNGAHVGEIRGITTGFASLDAHTLGWAPSDLIVIAARPSIGKTIFSMNAAVSAALAGKVVGIFSLEMKAKKLKYRMLSSLSGVPRERIKSGDLTPGDYQRLTPAMTRMTELPIFIDDHGRQTVDSIRATARRLRAEHGLDLLIIDYLQLMTGSTSRKGANRQQEISDISRGMKNLADELAVPMMLLSQLSRASDSRPDPTPKLSDLRESGAIEQDADAVGFLHRKHHRAGGYTAFILEKERDGNGGVFGLTLDRETVTFTDGGTADPVAPSEQQAERKETQRKFFSRPRR